MRLSVVIPVYNSEKTIERAVRSALDLDEKVEVVVINDGSTDGSSAILSELKTCYPDRIILHEIVNSGVSHARNLALEFATGDWITFLDSDDVLLTGYLNDLEALIANNPQCDVIRTSFLKDCRSTRTIVSFCPSDVVYSEDTERLYREIYGVSDTKLSSVNEIGFVCACFYRRDFLVNNNLFFDESISILEDHLLLLRAISYAKCVIVSPVLTYCAFVSNSGSLSTTWTSGFEQSLILALNKFMLLFASLSFDATQMMWKQAFGIVTMLFSSSVMLRIDSSPQKISQLVVQPGISKALDYLEKSYHSVVAYLSLKDRLKYRLFILRNAHLIYYCIKYLA